LSTNSRRELEEERRLLYVAITRAEEHCILTSAKNRFRYGRMEFDTPSRFINEIDPNLLIIEQEGRGADTSSPRNRSTFWNPNYDDRPEWQRSSGHGGVRQQNSRPVATQFMADPKPRVTAPRKPEQAVNPLSDSFRQQIERSGGNLRRVNEAIANGGRTLSGGAPSSQSAPLHEGNVIEHQRFGVGTVLNVEGTGENTKATVEFRHVGVKQLLLKFARYTVVK
jgi:DNA helicase-2/ATP-dependent DNA helicase PcrA